MDECDDECVIKEVKEAIAEHDKKVDEQEAAVKKITGEKDVPKESDTSSS